jgi:DNA-binding MarR family transcriptional regulator
MHRIFFSIKRAHLRIVEVSRKMVEKFEITPARFDMMRIVMLHEPDGLTQKKICALLGVSGATVSRMLKSLEVLGFVRRTPWRHDRRYLVVSLTKLGHERVDGAVRALIETGVADDMACRGVDVDPDAAIPRLRVLQRALSFMRRSYKDAAAFIDPWRTASLVAAHYHTIVNGRLHYTGDDPQPCVRYGDEYDLMPETG